MHAVGHEFQRDFPTSFLPLLELPLILLTDIQPLGLQGVFHQFPPPSPSTSESDDPLDSYFFGAIQPRKKSISPPVTNHLQGSFKLINLLEAVLQLRKVLGS